MDIIGLIKNVNNVDEYISITQKIAEECKDTKVQINMTTVFALKKIKSLEIEYLNKCYENGAACILFERLLTLPPSKTWGVLAKEMVSLLQYWLDAIRKYLINHSVPWWSFLKLILKFIKDICLKNSSIPNVLVELTAECLFDIATQDPPDEYQRHEILHCLNVFCAESSREIRFALRNKFEGYFTKLASHMCSGGYQPAQSSALEALVRWLVPRAERTLRAGAAERWFPPHACPAAAADIFLNAAWINFFQDARDFLNALNAANGLVISVVCRRLTIGNLLIISGAEKQQTWLDINSSGKSISILLDPRVMKTFGVLEHSACETLLITNDNTQTARMGRYLNVQSKSEELTISLTTFQPPRVVPIDIAVGNENDVRIVVSSRVDLTKLDTALRGVFEVKYQLLLNLDTKISLSPEIYRDSKKNQTSSEEDTRFSHPVEVKRTKHSESATGGLVSPSTASTSSLLQLHDKLAALPRFPFENKEVTVCKKPRLPSVSEKSFHSVTTVKFRPFGVCKNLRVSTQPPPNPTTKKRSESDTETLKFKPKPGRRLSPVVSDDNTTSCLLVATVGSSDDGVINATIERLSKSKEFQKDNLVDLLVQDAFQAQSGIEDKIVDSGINSQDNKSLNNEVNSEAIENTPVQDDVKEMKKSRIVRKKICTVVSRSTTTDESNTEAINETPALVSTRKIKLSRKQIIPEAPKPKEQSEKQCFDVNTVEEFFSQHFAETKAEEIAISPTVAKKINESNSESSDTFDEQYLNMNEVSNTDVEQFEFNDIEIIECLNDMVDKVCSDFGKFTEYLNKDNNLVGKNSGGSRLLDNQVKVSQENMSANVLSQQTDSASKPKRKIKLTYKAATSKKEKKTQVVAKKRKNNNDTKPTAKMSTIIEQKDEDILVDSPPKDDSEDINLTKVMSPEIKKVTQSLAKNNSIIESPLLSKKKRKLYSPKDDEMKKEKKGTKDFDEEDDDVTRSEFKKASTRNKTPKTTAACYKEIERERQNRIGLPRSRKPRGKVEQPPSPRTLKINTVFDKLKSTVESNEKVILADTKTGQNDIYNFTSDSEDDDFRKKTIEIGKRTSNTTVGSFESAMSKRAGRPRTRINYSEKSSNDEVKKPKPVRRKKAVKKTNSKSKGNVNSEPFVELLDEKIRDAGPEVLDTSIVVEHSKKTNPPEVELQIHEPQMEPIIEGKEATAPKNKKTKKTKKAETLSLKTLKHNESKLAYDKEEDRTESPLPGLIVETMPTCNDANDSVTNAMVQKFKKIYQDGPDANESSNTQNMLLSDGERCNYSPQNVSVGIADEICIMDYNKENIGTESKKEKTLKNIQDKQINQNIQLSNSKKKAKNVKPNFPKDVNNVIEISEIPDTKSERSINTDGITAHGDFDEAPPSPEMIRKSMYPREIVDLNESMKDYFLTLNREINESSSKERRESNKSEVEVCRKRLIKKENSFSDKSPVVSVLRLSLDDITKWLPSRRTSETSNSSKSSVIVSRESSSKLENMQKKTSHEFNREIKRSKIDSPKVMSPVVSIAKMSLEELLHLDKLLPMPRRLKSKGKSETSVNLLQKGKRQSSVKLVYNTRQKSNTGTVIKKLDCETEEESTTSPRRRTNATPKLAEAKSKTKTAHTTEENSDHASDSVKTPLKNKNTKTTIAKKPKGKKITNTDNDSDHSKPAGKEKISASETKRSIVRKTIISPIKSFENFVPNVQNSESEEDPCLNKIRHMLSKERTKSTAKEIRKPKSIELDSPDSTSAKINHERRQDSSFQKVKQNTISTREKSIVQLDLSSSKNESFKRPMKRGSSPILSETKKRRFVELDTVTIDSGPSVSTVNEWFRRMEPSRNRANDTSLMYKETIQNIMEKLDTTLTEMNQNTSKKFLNLFVEVQTQLSNQQEERRKRYKSVATQIITAMVAVMDEKFSELDRMSQEMNTIFKEQLKEKAFDLIREDCKQKRAMVLLLKDEVQAAFDHIERNSAESP